MRDPLNAWHLYPPPNAPRVPCVFCGRSFTTVCDSTARAEQCGNFWQREKKETA